MHTVKQLRQFAAQPVRPVPLAIWCVGAAIAAVVRAACGIRAVVAAWRQRDQERRELTGMSEFELRDIGISRSDVGNEVRKSFWQE
jgi:uncharacterized protein YjiS (DUF1127 family)